MYMSRTMLRIGMFIYECTGHIEQSLIYFYIPGFMFIYTIAPLDLTNV